MNNIEDLSNQDISFFKRLSIGSSTSESLAAQVVVYKALNIDKELALLCMKELVRRRNMGEDFNYEDFIQIELEKIPKMRDINMPEIGKRIMLSYKNIKPLGKNDS